MTGPLVTLATAATLWLAAVPAGAGAQERPSNASAAPGRLALGLHHRHAPGTDPLAPERAAIRAAARRSRWREGAVIGAVVFGTTGVVLAGGFCGANDSASANGCTAEILGGALLGGAIGGVFGGLIGAQIHRSDQSQP